MEDSAELAFLLRKGMPTEDTWRAYEQNRQFRARVVQSIHSLFIHTGLPVTRSLDMSRWIASVGQIESPPLRAARDLLMRATPTMLMTPAFNTVLRFCLGWNYTPAKIT